MRWTEKLFDNAEAPKLACTFGYFWVLAITISKTSQNLLKNNLE